MFNIIIPTYNEKDNISTLIKMVECTFIINNDYKIIIVDDGSTDGTREVVSSFKNVVLLCRPCKMGLGSAYKFALPSCTYPYTFILDADLSHDPLFMHEMIKIQKKTGSDIVSSTRYKNGGVYGWSFYRKLVSRGANNFAKILLNLSTSDLTGSYRLYKTTVLKSLINQASSVGYSIQMELIYYAEKNNYKITECPIIFYEREAGESKLSKKEIINFVKSVINLYFHK